MFETSISLSGFKILNEQKGIFEPPAVISGSHKVQLCAVRFLCFSDLHILHRRSDQKMTDIYTSHAIARIMVLTLWSMYPHGASRGHLIQCI